ncbi:hypothetical protein [Micromonospora sp. CPCC 206061]|uniref:hypothetical protein n=1 Tax=Micromonospora sp. CPCC 206061 TaxID=3122410 RepID=UPI002FF3A7C8
MSAQAWCARTPLWAVADASNAIAGVVRTSAIRAAHAGQHTPAAGRITVFVVARATTALAITGRRDPYARIEG